MPDGNFSALTTIRPSSSRDTCQPSSITRYSYPASLRPFSTITSAICLTSASLMSSRRAFQLFQPMGGVRARPSSRADALVAATTRRIRARMGRDGT